MTVQVQYTLVSIQPCAKKPGYVKVSPYFQGCREMWNVCVLPLVSVSTMTFLISYLIRQTVISANIVQMYLDLLGSCFLL